MFFVGEGLVGGDEQAECAPTKAADAARNATANRDDQFFI
jgi:hypothetical protein